MGRRLKSRDRRGRFRRATLENTFGLSTIVCQSCRRIHAYRDVPPERCDCGQDLIESLVDQDWPDDDKLDDFLIRQQST